MALLFWVGCDCEKAIFQRSRLWERYLNRNRKGGGAESSSAPPPVILILFEEFVFQLLYPLPICIDRVDGKIQYFMDFLHAIACFLQKLDFSQLFLMLCKKVNEFLVINVIHSDSTCCVFSGRLPAAVLLQVFDIGYLFRRSGIRRKMLCGR